MECERMMDSYDDAELLDFFGNLLFRDLFCMGGDWVVLAMRGWEVPSP